MTEMNRRLFLQLTGGAAVGIVASSALLSSVGRAATDGAAGSGSLYTFRAIAGLPAKPLPTYASYVLEGRIDLASGNGTVTRTIFAGAPEAMSAVAFPGLSRVVQITSVGKTGDTLSLDGLIEGSAPSAGEREKVHFEIDPQKGVASTDLLEPDLFVKLDR